MKVCAEGHDEIVFDDSAFRAECPACKLLAAIEEQDAEIDSMKEQIEDLNGQIEELQRGKA